MTVTSDQDALGRPSGLSLLARRATFGERMWYRYGLLIGPVLGWYLLFDKAGAYVRVPGTPFYLGECMIVVGITATLWATSYFRLPITREPLLMLLFIFIAWGAVRAVPQIPKYHTETIRDSALWYYALFAFFFIAATQVDRTLPARLVALFRRFVPWLLVWLPIALVASLEKLVSVNVPFSSVPAVTHRTGNLAVAAMIGLAGVWLLPDPAWSKRKRNLLTLLAIGTILLAGTQGRAGLGAAGIAILVGLCARFVPHPSRLIGRMALIGVAILVVGLVASVGVSTARAGRSFSVLQLVENVASVGGVSPSNDQGNLSGSISFRGNLESSILAKEVDENKFVQGFGFGPNLAALVGITHQVDQGQVLRSPHNSHVDVLARMGAIGALIWIVFWFGWFRRTWRAIRRLRNEGFHREQKALEVCFLAVIGILIDCAFDPTLEGAQVAALLWTVTALGLLLSGREGAGLLSSSFSNDRPGFWDALRRGTSAKLPVLASSYED